MKNLLIVLCFLPLASFGQIVRLLGDSTKVYSGKVQGNELILQNSTRTTKGFLFNYDGLGNTRFQRATQLNDTTIIMGIDTFRIHAPGMGGASFDSTSLSNRIDLKLNISDTAAMLSPYLKTISGIAAGGDLSGTYVNPSVVWANGFPTYDDRYLQPVSPDDSTSIIYYVLDSTCTIPGAPATDDAFLVCANPGVGAWSAHGLDIAVWNGSSWDFTDAVDGDHAYTTDDFRSYIFRSSTWTRISGLPVLVGGNKLGNTLLVGTNDNQSLIFKTNGSLRFEIKNNGNIRFISLPGVGNALLNINSTGVATRIEAANGYLKNTAGVWSFDNSTFGTGTVTNVATGLGLSGGPITATGTIILDTVSATVLSRQRAAATFYNSISQVNDSTYTINRPNGTADTIQFASGANGTVTGVTGTTNRITSSGGAAPVIDISASYVGQSSITTLGTISTGVWNGTTIAIANGGTGQTTANTAFNALAPSQGSNSGKYLTTDGTNTSWGTVASTSSPWTRSGLSGATSTTNIVQPATIADTVVVGGTGVTNGTNKPLSVFNVYGNQTIFTQGLGATIAPGLLIIDTVAATNGTVSLPGSIDLEGQAFTTGLSTSRKTRFRIKNVPVQSGGGTVSANFILSFSENGGAFTDPMTLTSGGVATFLSNVSAGSTGGATFLGAALTSNGNITLTGSGSGSSILFKEGGQDVGKWYATTGFFGLQNQGTIAADPGGGAGFGIFQSSNTGLAGSTTNSAGSAAVTGSGTAFTKQYKPGDQITQNTGTAETKTIASITDDTHLTTTVVWTNAHSSSTHTNATGGTKYLEYINGKVAVSGATSGAWLTLPAGIADASFAPLKFTSGTLLTTPENGAIEYDGTHFYGTVGGVRKQLDN